jgi:Asp-tRNA(Asn)/Glu-tRNA(Gln) amidotransferase A subunit family amidase
MERRNFLAALTALGFSSTSFGGELHRKLEEKSVITLEDIESAEKVAGLTFTRKERELLFKGVKGFIENYKNIRKLKIANSVPPALHFKPLVSETEQAANWKYVEADKQEIKLPTSENEVAFSPIKTLAALIRQRKMSCRELTDLYLQRLDKYDPKLKCTISTTRERAVKLADLADKELAQGKDRGLLHGIPWGAKDLLAVKGYKTTWGARPYEDQVIDEDATVVQKLDKAGAVLNSKLTLGALAWGDVWFGGTTRNPWDPEKGSSGSSAGPASAVTAGLTGFTIGSETWGSIVSPSTVCGATGLRPTFGRVSRAGAMALSWSMDKLGPICRSVEDCALVFDAIQGKDQLDPTTTEGKFRWRRKLDKGKIKFGYLESGFKADEKSRDKEWFEFDNQTLKQMEKLGYQMIPIELPEFPVNDLGFILSAEAAAAFDQLTLSGRDDLLVRQIENAWPNVFRQARLIPAVEYIQANRARTILMQKMNEMLQKVDLYLAPSFRTNNLLITNLTGHPCVVMPNGFRKNGTPTSITFNGRMHDEELLLAVAHDYQVSTDFHLQHPDMQKLV